MAIIQGQPTTTLGRFRVRAGFNPSANAMVDSITERTAQLIDLCESLKGLDGRCVALAQTAYEEAAMWAVKAATSGPSPVLDRPYPIDEQPDPPIPPQGTYTAHPERF